MCQERNTDVHGSIAGYYYQILLGCRELTKLVNLDDEVGIEAGADVRVVRESKKSSIEAKFHKDKMSAFDINIIKTIYNFYLNSYEDDELYFSTNVDLAEGEYKQLLKVDWDKEDNLNNKDKKCMFIKKCILRFSIKNDKDKQGYFEEYKAIKAKENGFSKVGDRKDKFYVDLLEKEIFEEGIREYDKYAVVNKNITYEEFANKIKFKFNIKDKSATIVELRKECIKNIKEFHWDSSIKGRILEDEEGEDILNAIIGEFFMAITENSKKKKPSIKDLKLISVKMLKECIDFHQDKLEKFEGLNKIKKVIEDLEDEEREFIVNVEEEHTEENAARIIELYVQVRNMFLEYIKNEENYNKIFETYSTGTEKSIGCISRVIIQIAVITAFRGKGNIYIPVIGTENDSIDNVKIEDIIEYCFKYIDNQSAARAERCIDNIMHNLYKNNKIQKISDNQIIVIGSPNLIYPPCQRRQEIIQRKYLQDITMTDQQELERYQMLFRKINYKCDRCLDYQAAEDEVNENIIKFLECK